MRDGTSQAQRRPPALADHYVDVDELALPQLMTLALAYADQMRFMELGADGKPASVASWRPYFSADETLVMAELLATRLTGLRAQFERALAHADNEQVLAPGTLARAAMPSRLLATWAAQLERWSAQLLKGGSAVGADLGLLSAGLYAEVDRGGALGNIRRFHSAPAAAAEGEWAALYGPGAAAALERDLRLPPGQQRRDLRRGLEWLFHSLFKAIDMSQAAAAERLTASMKSGAHDPGTGLLLAFLRLYQAAQAKLNRFTARHLDFYYEQVLRMRPNGFVRDSTILLFEPSQPGARVTVARGTEFLAPFDKSKPDIEFIADHELAVGDATVAALYTFYLDRNAMISPERELVEFSGGQRQQYPTGAWLDQLPAIPAEAAIDRTSLVSHPLFGAARDGAQSRQGERARLGFACASNVLLLHEGRRRVCLTLKFGAAAVQPDQPAETAARTLQARLEPLADLLRTSASDAFYKVFRNMFKIALTGPAGWIEVEEYSPALGGDEQDELVITIVLGDEQPPVVPYLPALHGDRYQAEAPLIRFELNRYGYLYPYGLLRDLPVREIEIEVEVSGHRQLLLYNSVGQLSATGPFNPFGPLPEIGSYLIVGSAETAAKQLDHFELELEWGGLPADPGGFRRYYGGYRDTPGYGDVKAAVTALADGKWLPQDPAEQPQVTLLDSSTSLRRVDRIGHAETLVADRTLAHTRPLPQLPPDGQFAYTPGAKGGFFKFTLASPAFAFGHRAYPLDLADALGHNSRERVKRLRRALPNPPYTPLVNAVAVNYRASATLAPDVRGGPRSQIIRLHPLGWDVLGANDAGPLLLPRIGFSGNLLIGLRSAGLGGALSLYFHLREDARPLVDSEIRQLCWFYLADNVWKPLEARRVLADSTRGFLRPGIVTLDLPHEISNGNTICPPGLYWLKVSAETGLSDFCSLYSVHAQALLVSRRPAALDDPAAPVLIPAATIRRPRKAIAGLGKVTQVVSSFGGRLPEDRAQLRIRTAERLKHKQRAVLADDYERLILERFPEIEKVKCFPNLSMRHRPDGTACPGHVLIVGLPRLTSRGHLSLLPTLNGYLIGQVREFITPLASPAVTIEVRNPVYQQIQVRCTVRFSAGADQGRCINQLDNAISDFISPWNDGGNTCHFGWCLHQHEIESYIRSFDFVENVTQFSMLSILGRDNHEYTLYDTAVHAQNPQAEVDIVPKYPWAIAVPIGAGHVIRTTDSAEQIAASRTGIRELAVSSTFIISSRRNHDQKE